jgi:hypothetical protein
MYQRAGVKVHHGGVPNAARDGFCCAINTMRSVLPYRPMFPRRRALPHQALLPLTQLILRPPQLPF